MFRNTPTRPTCYPQGYILGMQGKGRGCPRPGSSAAAAGPRHGWAVSKRIRQMSSEQLRVGQSALYPALHKLEQQGWIDAEWAASENNRRAKYYKLTAAGRKALKSETAQWERLSAAISLVVKPT